MSHENAKPAPAAAAVEAQAAAPTIDKPAIPEDIMDDMARACVEENVRQFIANGEPEAIARDIVDVMYDAVMDDDSIEELGDKIDGFLPRARMNAVFNKLTEMFGNDAGLAADATEAA